MPAAINHIDREFQISRVRKIKAPISLDNFEYPGDQIIAVDDQIDKRLTDGTMYRRIVNADNPLHAEGTFDVLNQFWNNPLEKIIQIIFPCAVIRQAIAPPASRESVCLVDIVHADMIKPLADRQTFSKHKKPRRRQPLTPGRALHRIAAKIH